MYTNCSLHGTTVPRSDGDIQAVSRCAAIMRMVAGGRVVRPGDIVDSLGLQRSTAHRYLASMEAAGILDAHPDGGLGPGSLSNRLGASAIRRSSVLRVSEPYITALAEEARETVVLSLWGGLGALVTRVHEDPSSLISVVVREGRLLPPAAAQSKVFLAHLRTQDEVERALAVESAQLRAEVLGQLDEIRRVGFAQYSSVVRGVHTVAVPIFAHSGIVAVLAFVGTSDSLAVGPGSGMWAALHKAASEISARLGNAHTSEFAN